MKPAPRFTKYFSNIFPQKNQPPLSDAVKENGCFFLMPSADVPRQCVEGLAGGTGDGRAVVAVGKG